MSKKLIIWFALISLILLSILCICNKKDKIEADILQKSIHAISEIEGFNGNITVDGLDITIDGVVNSEELKLNIEQLIGSERGVRNISNNLVVELPKLMNKEKLIEIQDALNKVMELDNIEFENNTAIIKPISEGIIIETAKILSDNPTVAIKIGGHTDSTGNEEYNIALSLRRSEAVLIKLINRNIARDRLTAIGYGSSQSIADNRTLEGQQKNRRVEFKIMEDK